MAPLRYAAKFDPFFSLDCAPNPSTLDQSKERKESNFAIWQPCLQINYGPSESMVFQTAETYNSGGWVKVEAARAERNGVETGVLRVVNGRITTFDDLALESNLNWTF